MTEMKLSEELVWRGFANQTTLSDLKRLDDEKWIFYHGYDASSDSLTIGNLAAVMLDKLFLRHGSKAILLAGGATSLIGDPGGKDSERVLQDEDAIAHNIRKVKGQIEALVGNKVHMVNNLDWFKDMSILEFLRDVGKHFSMTPLVQRDYIATRMGEKGSGISYTEFSYTLLQGYDFLHLYQKYGVELQLAGSDQWGNAISGVELVRRVEGKDVHALTMPLIINKSTGKKFGKSEEGAIWLDAEKTSPYQFYQFWLNVDDQGVEDYLKIYTELDKKQVDKVMTEFQSKKSERVAQKTLAYEVTKLVHGKVETEKIIEVTSLVNGREPLSAEQIELVAEILGEIPIANSELVSVICELGLASSRSQARQFVNDKAVYVNNQRIDDEYQSHIPNDKFHNGLIVVRRGNNTVAVGNIN